MNPNIILLVVYAVVGILILCIGAWNSDFDSNDDGPFGLIILAMGWPFVLAIAVLLSPIWIPGAIAVGISRLSKKVQAERNKKDTLQECLTILNDMEKMCQKATKPPTGEGKSFKEKRFLAK